VISERAWNWKRSCFTATFEGATVDASLLLLAEVGFLEADRPALCHHGRRDRARPARDGFIFRYVDADDFGAPENAFLVCSFWYVNALAALERRDEARALFEKLLACATATACWPSTSIRRAANSGATSSRPTAWSG
jgi:GH15 family glucan-1,4-alpha-glucosidase